MEVEGRVQALQLPQNLRLGARRGVASKQATESGRERRQLQRNLPTRRHETETGPLLFLQPPKTHSL